MKYKTTKVKNLIEYLNNLDPKLEIYFSIDDYSYGLIPLTLRDDVFKQISIKDVARFKDCIDYCDEYCDRSYKNKRKALIFNVI